MMMLVMMMMVMMKVMMMVDDGSDIHIGQALPDDEPCIIKSFPGSPPD